MAAVSATFSSWRPNDTIHSLGHYRPVATAITARIAFRNHWEYHMQMQSGTWCVNIYEVETRVDAVRGLDAGTKWGKRELDETIYYSANNLQEYL